MKTAKGIKSVLQSLADNWNDKYWLYVADSSIYIMKKKDGEIAVTDDGGVDQNYIIDSVSFPVLIMT